MYGCVVGGSALGRRQPTAGMTRSSIEHAVMRGGVWVVTAKNFAIKQNLEFFHIIH